MARVNYGGGQAIRLCQMSQADRLKFLSEGLPTILESARGFWTASLLLESKPREMEVMEIFAEEEAAKALILIDIARCPRKRIGSRLNIMVRHFYDHLARLIYADAQHWKPMHMKQLREYVDRERRAHYLEGYAGEWILPNSTIARRESVLYADVEAYENGALIWNKPDGVAYQSALRLKPTVVKVVEALSAVGGFTEKGLGILSEVWGKVEFCENENNHDAERLTAHMLKKLIDENLALENAEQRHVDTIYHSWQMPMYNLELTITDMPLSELEEEREMLMRWERGY